jgi:2-iminoacetate synthase
MSFFDILLRYDWNEILADIRSKNASQVKNALEKSRRGKADMEDFKSLVSPAAEPFLEEMAVMSRQLTLKRFGKTLQLYIPLYVSNECRNPCVYCGFNRGNDIARKTLTLNELRQEAAAIRKMGFNHILLVSGEHPAKAGMPYFESALEILRPQFSHISMEVQPLDREEYEALIAKGLNSIYIYQETYNREAYGRFHPGGRKADFRYRLETPDRLGAAGIRKIGLGTLLGLQDWRADAFYTALHLNYLEKTWWKTLYCISFPRLRPSAGEYRPEHPVSDRHFVQLLLAYRIFNENVELSLSTRESGQFRDKLLGLGITAMSAGSKTRPGGHAQNSLGCLEQFSVSDERSPAEVAELISQRGYDPKWKDWDAALETHEQQTMLGKKNNC